METPATPRQGFAFVTLLRDPPKPAACRYNAATVHLLEEALHTVFCGSQEKFHTVVLRGVGNISEAPVKSPYEISPVKVYLAYFSPSHTYSSSSSPWWWCFFFVKEAINTLFGPSQEKFHAVVSECHKYL